VASGSPPHTQVGINSATLHHYFATKQDLVVGIAEHLEHRLRTEHAPSTQDEEQDPFGRQFQDLLFYQKKTPEILAVYRELVARAPRPRSDPVRVLHEPEVSTDHPLR
jgi:AcrR family transcriptional regulator